MGWLHIVSDSESFYVPSCRCSQLSPADAMSVRHSLANARVDFKAEPPGLRATALQSRAANFVPHKSDEQSANFSNIFPSQKCECLTDQSVKLMLRSQGDQQGCHELDLDISCSRKREDVPPSVRTKPMRRDTGTRRVCIATNPLQLSSPNCVLLV